jgi:hypothetical protein
MKMHLEMILVQVTSAITIPKDIYDKEVDEYVKLVKTGMQHC